MTKNDVVVVHCWWIHDYVIWMLLDCVSDDKSCIVVVKLWW